jgi:ribosome maturation factor RimP
MAGTGNTMEDRVRTMAEEVIGEGPVYLIDVEVRGQKGSVAIDVIIESDGDLTIEEIARVSRQLNTHFEEIQLADGNYSLNVSSPGVSRPLELPRQFRKNVGRKLKVELREDDGSKRAVTGELVAANEASIDVNSGGAIHTIAYGDILRARVQLPW